MNFSSTKSRSNENEHKVFTHHSLQQNHPMTLMQSVFSTIYVYGSLFVAMIYSLVLRNEYYVLKVRSYENLENQKNQKNQKGRN